MDLDWWDVHGQGLCEVWTRGTCRARVAHVCAVIDACDIRLKRCEYASEVAILHAKTEVERARAGGRVGLASAGRSVWR